eukprot:Hpha_TRINITY_DN16425_c0_g3::TRINITY_DN16425_c0_g3_i4::g.159468::m.159468/K05991/E3.2.1.123; endoglycosylceramidase
MWKAAALMAALGAAQGAVSGIHIDPVANVWRDGKNRSLIFRGTNFVKKEPPYYVQITDDDIQAMHEMGMNTVRLGVMMPGLFPTNSTPDTGYLDTMEGIVGKLWKNGIMTVIDLHQDVLNPKLCGEGTPAWMLNVSELGCMDFPEPMTFNKSITGKADPSTGDWTKKTCGPWGLLKFIGWSEGYMTDACGRAFQRIYDREGLMAHLFEVFWSTVAGRFKGNPGVLAYELLNEPWVGDHVRHPGLILEGGKAEKEGVGAYMQRMHGVVRSVDTETPTLFAPAEINNRAMRHVGYEAGFLKGEPMAFHVYCITGTDGPGPTTPITIDVCHFNDKFQLSTRSSDIARLGTAGLVTEFGAVSDSATGLNEVRFVAEHFDAASPPFGWLYWDRIPSATDYKTELARSYPSAVAGTLSKLQFNANTSQLVFAYSAVADGVTDVVLPRDLRYPSGFDVSVVPSGCCTTADTPNGVSVTATTAGDVTVTVTRK